MRTIEELRKEVTRLRDVIRKRDAGKSERMVRGTTINALKNKLSESEKEVKRLKAVSNDLFEEVQRLKQQCEIYREELNNKR